MSAPKSVLNKTPAKDYEVYRGAPLPIPVRRKVNGVYQPFDATLKFVFKPQGGAAVELGVGSGITLSPFNAVANAQAVIQLSAAQSLQVVKGEFTSFKLLQGVAGSQTPLLRGRLIGAED